MPIVWICLVVHSVYASYHLDVFQIQGFAPLFEQAKLRIQREMQARSVAKGVICFFCGCGFMHHFLRYACVGFRIATGLVVCFFDSIGFFRTSKNMTGVEQHESGQRRVLEGTEICALLLGFELVAFLCRFVLSVVSVARSSLLKEGETERHGHGSGAIQFLF